MLPETVESLVTTKLNHKLPEIYICFIGNTELAGWMYRSRYFFKCKKESTEDFQAVVCLLIRIACKDTCVV